MKKRYVCTLTSCILLLCYGCANNITEFGDVSMSDSMQNSENASDVESETLNVVEDVKITPTFPIMQSTVPTTSTTSTQTAITRFVESTVTAYIAKLEEPAFNTIKTTQTTCNAAIETTQTAYVVATTAERDFIVETTSSNAESFTEEIPNGTTYIMENTNTINTTETITTTTMSKTSEAVEWIGFQDLPDNILVEVNAQKAVYPGMNISMGIFSLDGSKGYVYNPNEELSAACTIKAAYAMYVMQVCEKNDINIWSEYITYEYGMRNDGSGIIKNQPYGTQYTIAELLQLLLSISDNTAYNILVSQFTLQDYQVFLNSIGGQNLYGLQYGCASVLQRKNEWIAIYNYINSGSLYSDVLRQYLTGTYYCYLVNGMNGLHSYMHKSGWSDGDMYNSASDCAIIDNNYLLIVLTQDYSTGIAHIDVVNALGRATEIYADSIGGSIF